MWKDELIELCQEAKKEYSRSEHLTFADVAIKRSELNKVLSLLPPGLEATGTEAYSFYGDDEVVIDFDSPATSAWLRFFVWGEGDLAAGAIEICVSRDGFTEVFVLDVFSRDDTPVVSSSYDIHAFMETGYSGHPGVIADLTPEQANDYINAVKEIVRL